MLKELMAKMKKERIAEKLFLNRLSLSNCIDNFFRHPRLFLRQKHPELASRQENQTEEGALASNLTSI